MSSVVAIRPGLEPISREPVTVVVDELQSLLDAAKAGEIAAIAIAINHPGDLTSWRRAGRQTRALIGTLEMLKYDMCRCDYEDKE